MKKNRAIELLVKPNVKMKRVDFMNALAGVVQILHTDPLVKTVNINIVGGRKVPIKLV